MPRRLAAATILVLALAGCGGKTLSPQMIEGRDLYATNCSVCHGSTGHGGTAPSLEDVAETFPSCDAHIEWVTLGSESWKLIYGETYGANNSPIKAVMPAHGKTLTTGEIALVAAFERVSYGGVDEAVAASDCGLEVGSSSAP